MEILGHSQISMTSRYTHVLPQVMTEAAARMGQALWPVKRLTATMTATRELWAIAVADIRRPVSCGNSLEPGGAPGGRTLNQQIKSLLLYH